MLWFFRSSFPLLNWLCDTCSTRFECTRALFPNPSDFCSNKELQIVFNLRWLRYWTVIPAKFEYRKSIVIQCVPVSLHVLKSHHQWTAQRWIHGTCTLSFGSYFAILPVPKESHEKQYYCLENCLHRDDLVEHCHRIMDLVLSNRYVVVQYIWERMFRFPCFNWALIIVWNSRLEK